MVSCSKSQADINALFSAHDLKIEVAKEVEILYSDSAEVKLKISAPTLKRYIEVKNSIDEFPDGLVVEFFDKRGKVISWLEADYAIRKDEVNKIFVKENVKLYNQNNDELNTDELIWDEKSGEVYTDKYVRIAQHTTGDTLYGFGFLAKQEFQRFQLNKKVSGVKFLELDEILKN